MSLDQVPGQTRAKRFLRRLLATGNIPHALLFSGIAGIGRFAVAMEFARLLNCRNLQKGDSCHECPSCRKIDTGHHPDIVVIRKDGAFIKLDQIREIKDRLKYRPFEGRWRVVIIQDAQDLRQEAGNALLKLLEEPPKQNIFLITVTEAQKLLPTIVSRCCHVRFQPLEDRWIEEHLRATYGMAGEQSQEITRLAEGSLERARWFAEEERIAHRNEILGHMARLGELSMFDLFGLTAQWAQSAEDLEQDLECIKLWVRDLVLTHLMVGHSPAFPMDEKTLGAARRQPAEYFFELYDDLDQAVQHLRLNANKQLTLEGVCLAIKDVLYGKGSRYPVSHGR